MIKLIRTSTVAISLDTLLKGQLSFLKQYYDVIAISGQDKHLENVAKREKVRTISVTFQRQISPIKDLISLIKLYKILKTEKPYIVHSITPKAGLLTMIAGYFAGVPIRIHTFTGLIFPSKTGLMKILLINMDRILCLFATQIIPEGNGVKNDLINYKITKKPLNIIANGNVNGINTVHFNPDNYSKTENNKLRKQLNISKNDFVSVFVGRLVSDKGINELISAFEKLNRNQKNSKLLLVGSLETELDPLNKETLIKINKHKNIISVGYQQDVRPYFAIANVLTFPSYREGFPNVVLQAGAMGLPSIVSNINGCNEIIEHNKNGIIIPVKDSNALFIAMKELLTNKVLYKELQQNARERIVNNYQQQVVWDALLAEYRSFF